MKRTVLSAMRSWSLALAIGMVAVPVALADTATTGPPSSVTATSALLHGTVNSGSQPGFYQFQYGLTRPYSTATPLQLIDTGGRDHAVSASITNLKPNTLYHFRMVFIARGGPYYDYETIDGPDQTFRTTANGPLVLVSPDLVVKWPHLTAILSCTSRVPCTGTYSVTTRTRLARSRRFATIVCSKPGSASFTIPALRTRRIAAQVTAGCASLLRHARNHQLDGKFSSRPRSGQPGIVTRIRLTLG